MAPPIALITGASSGIGLALTKYLLERGWNVMMGDINPPKETLEGTKFTKCDVSNWDQQASMFQQTYEWQGRLDFCALNAGIDDRDDIFNSISSDSTKPPRKPNMQTLEVNLIGAYYGCKLAAHYMSLDSKAAGKSNIGGKIVVTASAAGIYPSPFAPQYAAAKHGLVGLVRSFAARSELVNIRISAVCPALVVTGLAPPGLLDQFTQEQFTPMSTILRCFSELALLENVRDEDWVAKGPNGETVEGNLKELVWHQPPAQAKADYKSGQKAQDAWFGVYIDRNRKFAAMDWTNGTGGEA